MFHDSVEIMVRESNNKKCMTYYVRFQIYVILYMLVEEDPIVTYIHILKYDTVQYFYVLTVIIITSCN